MNVSRVATRECAVAQGTEKIKRKMGSDVPKAMVKIRDIKVKNALSRKALATKR